MAFISWPSVFPFKNGSSHPPHIVALCGEWITCEASCQCLACGRNSENVDSLSFASDSIANVTETKLKTKLGLVTSRPEFFSYTGVFKLRSPCQGICEDVPRGTGAQTLFKGIDFQILKIHGNSFLKLIRICTLQLRGSFPHCHHDSSTL